VEQEAIKPNKAAAGIVKVFSMERSP